MQHSDDNFRALNSYGSSEDLAEVLDRTIRQYDRLIQEQRLLLERLRTEHHSQSRSSVSDFIIRKAA